MSETKRERGIKVLVQRPVWIEGEDGNPKRLPSGEIVVLSKEEVSQFGKAVTRDLPEGEE